MMRSDVGCDTEGWYSSNPADRLKSKLLAIRKTTVIHLQDIIFNQYRFSLIKQTDYGKNLLCG